LRRPKVIINSAISADGKISSFERRQVRISGKADLRRVDILRSESDAIMVGVETVLADDPGLRVKSEQLRTERAALGKPENPMRVVADSLARTPPDAQVLGVGCIVAVSAAAPQERLANLARRCEVVRCGDERVDLRELLRVLYEKGVKHLMVEGGGTLNWSMVQEGLVDEICTYIGALIIGGKDAPTLMDGIGYASDFPRLKLISLERLDDGALLKWRLADL
jgi:2,5-diamino-6-(ribosylamino)-4(3H)-pyrimidinone 5'-phosphate reductase